MEKLWKSYGISFLGICTNPEFCLYLPLLAEGQLGFFFFIFLFYLAFLIFLFYLPFLSFLFYLPFSDLVFFFIFPIFVFLVLAFTSFLGSSPFSFFPSFFCCSLFLSRTSLCFFPVYSSHILVCYLCDCNNRSFCYFIYPAPLL